MRTVPLRERITRLWVRAPCLSKRTPRSHHINTVNALIGRFRGFMKPFCGPASKNLAAYGRWHAARDNTDFSLLPLPLCIAFEREGPI